MKYSITLSRLFFLLLFVFIISGCKDSTGHIDNTLYRLEGWQKEGNSWYYYKNGKLLRNKVVNIDGCLYLFLPNGKMLENNVYELNGNEFRAKSNGILYRNEWYKNIDEDWYYYDKNGIMVKNAWNENYYLLADGRMAKSQFVDRFYINADGLWKINDYSENSWLVEGNWITDDGLYYFQNTSGEKQFIDLSRVKSINRLGYDTVSETGFPQQSIIALLASGDYNHYESGENRQN